MRLLFFTSCQSEYEGVGAFPNFGLYSVSLEDQYLYRLTALRRYITDLANACTKSKRSPPGPLHGDPSPRGL